MAKRGVVLVWHIHHDVMELLILPHTLGVYLVEQLGHGSLLISVLNRTLYHDNAYSSIDHICAMEIASRMLLLDHPCSQTIKAGS